MSSVVLTTDRTWRLVLASFLPPSMRIHADRWTRSLPILLVLLLQGTLTIRLRNTAFSDEALYIQAGHDYLNLIFNGTRLPVDYGSFFSGAPFVYPVLAALLDGLGGLWLVRAFSLLCLLATGLCVRTIAKDLFGPRAGWLSAYAFATTGPVLFLGGLATFDAICVLALASALALLSTRSTYRSAVLAGAALALAVMCKYTGAVFVPVVLIVAIAVKTPRRAQRVALAGIATMAILAGCYVLAGAALEQGIVFTTTGRTALSPAPQTQLLGYLIRDVGLLGGLAVAGGVRWIGRPRLRRAMLVFALLAAAAALPLGQLRMGEAVSFEKHTAYSAFFLAPLAGLALAQLSRTRLRLLASFVALGILGIIGLGRSHAMYQWPDVSPVLRVISQDPVPGRYLSTEARSLSYYTAADHPDIVWDEQYGLFDSGPEVMHQAVREHRYKLFVYTTGSSGNKVADGRLARFVAEIRASEDYELVGAPLPTQKYSTNRWIIYRLISAPHGPGQSAER